MEGTNGLRQECNFSSVWEAFLGERFDTSVLVAAFSKRRGVFVEMLVHFRSVVKGGD